MKLMPHKRELGFIVGEKVEGEREERNMTLSTAPNKINAKLLKKFIGLYTMKDRLGENVYRLEMDGRAVPEKAVQDSAQAASKIPGLPSTIIQ